VDKERLAKPAKALGAVAVAVAPLCTPATIRYWWQLAVAVAVAFLMEMVVQVLPLPMGVQVITAMQEEQTEVEER
jgi:hypothetical protein